MGKTDLQTRCKVAGPSRPSGEISDEETRPDRDGCSSNANHSRYDARRSMAECSVRDSALRVSCPPFRAERSSRAKPSGHHLDKRAKT